MTEARDLTRALGGTWYGHYGTAPCPVCQQEARADQNALTISDGNRTLLAHCKRLGCDFSNILATAGLTAGNHAPPDPVELAQREAEHRENVARRESQARAVWRESRPVRGTPAETYLRSRGITCELPETLRYHRGCWHKNTAKRHPALVAIVCGGAGFAIHRTYLRPNGDGKADIAPDKAMLGKVVGGAVHLSDGHCHLVVAEGIETSLSLRSGLLATPASVWATLSTSGLRGLRLPLQPGLLTIASDGDQAGRAAADSLAFRAHALGWTVDLLHAPDGLDWNDVLTKKEGAR